MLAVRVVATPGRGAIRRTGMATRVASVAENDDLRHREIVGMRDRQQRRTAAHRLEPSRRTAVQPQLRRTAAPYHFHVAPEDPVRVAGPERLHRRFLRREPPGEMDRRLLPAHAVGDLTLGEDALQEPGPVPIDGRDDARDFGEVDAESDNVW